MEDGSACASSLSPILCSAHPLLIDEWSDRRAYCRANERVSAREREEESERSKHCKHFIALQRQEWERLPSAHAWTQTHTLSRLTSHQATTLLQQQHTATQSEATATAATTADADDKRRRQQKEKHRYARGASERARGREGCRVNQVLPKRSLSTLPLSFTPPFLMCRCIGAAAAAAGVRRASQPDLAFGCCQLFFPAS